MLTLSFSMEQKHMGRPSSVVHPEWAKNAVIYEVNIRQYTPEGTFTAFEKHLPRLKGMGIGILWLMPVNPIGIINRKGSLGSYYSIKDFLGVNPELGTLDDLKHLVNKAHELGMKVIIDWVADHSSWDNNLITEHPEWYQHDSSGKIKSPVPDWTDVAGLDYTQPGLCNYMTDALIWWVKNADVDGFRCDVAGMLPVSFWNEAIPKVRKVKHIFMLAEDEEPKMHDIAFDMTYSWDLYHLMIDIAKGTRQPDEIDSLLAKEKAGYPDDAYRMRFTSNHDENTWNGTEYERMGNAAKTFAVLCYLLPGMPLIYSGQESAFNRRLKFFDKDIIEWDNYSLEQFYSKLNVLKYTHSCLWNGSSGSDFKRVNSKNTGAVFAFMRKNEKTSVFVVLNLSGEVQHPIFTGNDYFGDWVDLFTNETIQFTEPAVFQMKPWEYRVYTIE